MKPEDVKKISCIVHASDRIKEASRSLLYSLGPMGKTGFSMEELEPFVARIESIRAEMSQLQIDLMKKIYKCPDS
ncbi:MAG: hypothetical protein PHE67_11500 [Campylobacterales bacterium]|nr:hypothetical protein [Campylobacterales bacterium]